jgi:hypothetical protein
VAFEKDGMDLVSGPWAKAGRRTGAERGTARRHHNEPPHGGFRRPQYAEHRPMERPRQPLDCAAAGHGTKRGHDPEQWLAMASDGLGEVRR